MSVSLNFAKGRLAVCRSRYYLLFLISIIGVLAACDFSPRSAEPTVHLIVPTRENTATATLTHTPTNTLVPTETATATETQAATATETQVATETFTLTPVPATNTPTQTQTNTATATLESTATPQPVVEFFNYTTSYEAIPLYGIEKDQPVTGQVTDQQPASAYVLTAQAGDIIDIDLAALNNELDAVLLVLTAKGQEIARNEDTGVAGSALSIKGLALVDAGDYIIAVTRYYGQVGFSEGTFELSVNASAFTTFTEGELTTPLSYGIPAKGVIKDDTPFAYYTFRANEGDVISLEMRRASNDLDPSLMLLNNQGTVLISNDDNPLNTGTVDALINNFVIPVSGYYTIVATRFFSEESNSFGTFELELNILDTNSDNAYPVDAILNAQNSRTIRADRQFFTAYVIGDVVDVDNVEQRLQALLTFAIPPNISIEDVSNVTFDTGFCFAQGDAFANLGELTVYHDSYGRLDLGRDLTRTATGARIIARMTDCHSLDLTEAVVTALQNEQHEFQLRFAFRNSPANGQTDQIRFASPRLLIGLN